MLVVNADDLGFTDGVTRGILEAHRAGAVTSASMLVTAPGFEAAARAARAAPALGVGLHLNLVQGRPLSRAASLTGPDGAFLPLGRLALRAAAGRVLSDDVRREVHAQLAALRAAGIAPTHLDSHRHPHALPGLWRPVAAAAAEGGVPWIRWPREPLALAPLRLDATARKLVLAGALAVAPAPAAPLRRTDGFAGVSLQGGGDVVGRLLRTLDALPGGVCELMVHPGHPDAALAALDPYLAPREVELAALLDPRVRARLAHGDLRLAHFGELAGPGPVPGGRAPGAGGAAQEDRA